MKELRTLFTPRDIPLLFVVLPQSYVVALWLWQGSGHTGADLGAFAVAAWVALLFAMLGGLGYEAIYVGAVAWARRVTGNRAAHLWAFLTALASLGFSIGVAVYVYRAQGTAAWLHAGFPLVAFLYTVMTFAAHGRAERPAGTRGRRRLVRALVTALRSTRAEAASYQAIAAQAETRARADVERARADTARVAADLAQARAQLAQAPAQADGLDARTVAQWLADAGVSGREVARRLGVSESTVRGWRAPRTASAAD